MNKAFKPALLLSLMLVAAPGCSQKAMTLIPNVDRLMKETEGLNKRVAFLEAGKNNAQAKEVEELKKSVSALGSEIRGIKAESAANTEKLRQEFAFLKGNVEEAQHSGKQVDESLRSIEESFNAVNERLSTLERTAQETEKKAEALRLSMQAAEEKLNSLDSRSQEASAQSEPEKQPQQTEPEALYFSGYQETIAKNYPKASEIFSKFLEEFPKHKLADHAQYWLGEIHYAKGEWEKAILEFNKVIEAYPSGDKVPAATLKQGFSFEKLGAMKESKVLLQRVVDRFPKSPEAGIAKKRLEASK